MTNDKDPVAESFALTEKQRAMIVALDAKQGWGFAPDITGRPTSDSFTCGSLVNHGMALSRKAGDRKIYCITPFGCEVAKAIRSGVKQQKGRRGPSNWQPGPDHIQVVERAAEMFGISPELIYAKRRGGIIHEARLAAVLAIHNRWPELSYFNIGKCIKREDHSTIVWAVNRAFRKMEKEEWFRDVVEELCEVEILPLAPPPQVEANVGKLEAYWKARDEKRIMMREAMERDDIDHYTHLSQARENSRLFLAALARERPQMHRF